MLPMAEMMGWLRRGVGKLVRQAGLQLMDLLMQGQGRRHAVRADAEGAGWIDVARAERGTGTGWGAQPTAAGKDGQSLG